MEELIEGTGKNREGPKNEAVKFKESQPDSGACLLGSDSEPLQPPTGRWEVTLPLPASELQVAQTGNGTSHIWKLSREAGSRAVSTAEEEKNLGEDREL